MMKLYDADYIIRKNNEYEEQRLYNSPAEKNYVKWLRKQQGFVQLKMKNAKLEKRNLKQKN